MRLFLSRAHISDAFNEVVAQRIGHFFWNQGADQLFCYGVISAGNDNRDPGKCNKTNDGGVAESKRFNVLFLSSS